MQRRILAKSAFATAAVALPLAAARAQSAAQSQTPMSAGLTTNMDLNLIFTSANPGHWAGVESLHVPDITVSGSTLTVRTPHPMSQPHYIVSHTVVLEGGKFLDRKTFTWTDQPVSMHTLPDGYRGQVTVTSTCNLHDFWMATITV